MTTTFPRSDERRSEPGPFSRSRLKSDGHRLLPARELLRDVASCRSGSPSRSSRPSSDATSASAPACPASLSLRHQCGDDEHRRPDVDGVEQPLGVRDVHPDAAVRDGVADRGRVRRPVDPDAGRREPHPARAERVVRARRDRLLAPGPTRVRRVPPGVAPLDLDLEAPERGRVDGLARGDAEVAAQLVEAVEEQAGSSRAG